MDTTNKTTNSSKTLKAQIAADKATLPGWRRAGTPRTGKVPVSLRAVIQRLNRKLAADDEVLKKARGQRWQSDLGDYYIVNANNNMLVGGHINPEEEARERGVLKPYEEVVDDG
jgi:hypothetical protein